MGGWTGTCYDEIVVGQTFPPYPIEIDAGALQRFHSCLGENRPTPAPGTRIPAFLLNELRALKSQMRLPPGVLHAQEEITMASAARLGEPLETTVRIAEKYVRNQKRFVVVEQHVRCASDCRLIMHLKHVLYWPC